MNASIRGVAEHSSDVSRIVLFVVLVVVPRVVVTTLVMLLMMPMVVAIGLTRSDFRPRRELRNSVAPIGVRSASRSCRPSPTTLERGNAASSSSFSSAVSPAE